jgi:hypothetical protein
MCVPCLPGSRGFHTNCVHEVFLAPTSREFRMWLINGCVFPAQAVRLPQLLRTWSVPCPHRLLGFHAKYVNVYPCTVRVAGHQHTSFEKILNLMLLYLIGRDRLMCSALQCDSTRNLCVSSYSIPLDGSMWDKIRCSVTQNIINRCV